MHAKLFRPNFGFASKSKTSVDKRGRRRFSTQKSKVKKTRKFDSNYLRMRWKAGFRNEAGHGAQRQDGIGGGWNTGWRDGERDFHNFFVKIFFLLIEDKAEHKMKATTKSIGSIALKTLNLDIYLNQ